MSGTEFSSSIAEIKENIKVLNGKFDKLNESVITIARHGERLGVVESRVGKIEEDIGKSWKCIREIAMNCTAREPMLKYVAKKMEEPHVSQDDWLSLFLGSAVRNGIWIVLTGLLMGFVNSFFRG